MTVNCEFSSGFPFGESIESEMTLQKFTFYTVPQLKEYVSDWGLTVSGTKEELVARAFVASELRLPLKKSELQMKKDLILGYNKLLSVSDQRMLPDLLKIPEDQWVGEKEGIKCWPPIYISDISDFYKLKNRDNTLDLTSRIINEYKEGKAFRYYADGWLKEVFYHQVPENDYCFLKAKCTPSQKIKDPPHSLWVCATAHDEIHSAYCSCTAGTSIG
ncbi:uncharacterized protein [Ptychodera flava]|uniref:uncharacterized protein isoform X2 n=1 Tax=Ptychodera flava TaxID=63121 RepID=UPI00396A385D